MISCLKQLGLLCALAASVWACNSAETSNSETADTDSKSADKDSEGTDEPAWVNSMYLTCDWNSVETRNQVGVACYIASKDATLTPSAAGLEERNWKTVDSAGKTVSSEDRKEGEKNIFIINAQSVISLGPQVTLSDGKFDKVLTTRFEDLLEGLKKGGKLDACFNAEISIDECFKAMGIKLPMGDRYRNSSSVKPEESACANKDTLPAGVPCEITSDAMAGDLDQAREWYAYGNDLITADGKLKSNDFCDAKGIKASAPRGTISVKPRWYPYWKQSTKPCFKRFSPKGAPEDYDNKFIVYNGKDGIGNEPYCMFAVMAEPSIFGGTILRMHIFKNPKIFADSAGGKDLTVTTLEAFAEQFACTD
jgi:hypothetical protein